MAPQFAHPDGYTTLALTEDGSSSSLVTAGADAVVNVFNPDDLSARPRVITLLGSPSQSTSIAVAAGKLVISRDDNVAQLYDLATGNLAEMVERRTTIIRQVAMSKDGDMVAIAGDENDVKVFSMDDGSSVLLKGHVKPVISVSFRPAGCAAGEEQLATTSSDGSLAFWSVVGEKVTLRKMLKNAFPKFDVNIDPASHVAYRPTWHPKGSLFALPGKNEIILIDADTFNVHCTLKDSKADSENYLVQWSPNGQCLVSCGKSKKASILLWDVAQQECIQTKSVGELVSDFAFHPVKNLLFYSSMDGTFNTWEDLLPARLAEPPRQQQKSSKRQLANEMMIEEVEDLFDQVSEPPKSTTKSSKSDLERGRDRDRERERDRDRERVRDCDRDRSSYAVVGPSDMQAAFQPGSTPIGRKKRFLDWNTLGTITSHDEGASFLVEIEFHDKSSYRDAKFNEPYGYTMGVLGKRGALFSSPKISHPGKDGKVTEIPAKIYHTFHNIWSADKEWNHSLDLSEDVLAIALADNWVAVATSKNFLRIFSATGIQLSVLSLPGPVVSLAAYDWTLAIVFHSGAAFAGEQCLSLSLLNVEKSTYLHKNERVALSTGALLKWIGFDDAGELFTFDTEGVLRTLFKPFNFAWVPVLDLSHAQKHTMESYFAVAVEENKFIHVVCKGDEYPMVHPRPSMSDLGFKAPLLTDVNSASEAEWIRKKMAVQEYRRQWGAADEGTEDIEEDKDFHKLQVESDKVALRLVLDACKAEKNLRAVELCTFIFLPKSLQNVIKYAQQNRLPNLAERVEILRQALLRQGDEEKEKKKKNAAAASRARIQEEERSGRNAMEDRSRTSAGTQKPRAAPPVTESAIDSGFGGNMDIGGYEPLDDATASAVPPPLARTMAAPTTSAPGKTVGAIKNPFARNVSVVSSQPSMAAAAGPAATTAAPAAAAAPIKTKPAPLDLNLFDAPPSKADEKKHHNAEDGGDKPAAGAGAASPDAASIKKKGRTQSTLFGLAPGAAAAPTKRAGGKRKPEEQGEGEHAAPKAPRGKKAKQHQQTDDSGEAVLANTDEMEISSTAMEIDVVVGGEVVSAGGGGGAAVATTAPARPTASSLLSRFVFKDQIEE